MTILSACTLFVALLQVFPQLGQILLPSKFSAAKTPRKRRRKGLGVLDVANRCFKQASLDSSLCSIFSRAQRVCCDSRLVVGQAVVVQSGRIRRRAGTAILDRPLVNVMVPGRRSCARNRFVDHGAPTETLESRPDRGVSGTQEGPVSPHPPIQVVQSETVRATRRRYADRVKCIEAILTAEQRARIAQMIEGLSLRLP
jgi:hypothetical protein